MVGRLIDCLTEFYLQTFLGNSDRATVAKHFFSPDTRVFARSIRFHPKAWAGHISMRVEIYGCREGKTIGFFVLLYQTSQEKTCSDDKVEFVLLFKSALYKGRQISLVTALQR